MYYTKTNLKDFQIECSSLITKKDSLVKSYVFRDYESSKAREYATHGFIRRLQIMVRCIERVFDILPPDRTELADDDERQDAVINIQAFVFNVYGCIDNLAWVWVQEKKIANRDGSQIQKGHVGLRKSNKTVRASFSPEFQKYLRALDDWFDYLDNFRHSLAHRVPLYIPPYVVPESKLDTYQAIESRIADAANRLDFKGLYRLEEEQKALGRFEPSMIHSFTESLGRVMFHPQMLADFNTIEELGRKILNELDR